jgi:eukaryotic-like serine/threonine-protein kinase
MSHVTPEGPSTDRNLLFGVLALQADLLDAARFAEACTAWSDRKETPLGQLLVERGWLTSEDRNGVEQLLDRKLGKHAGDIRASLAEVLSDRVRETVTYVADAGIQQTVDEALATDASHERSTVAHRLDGRDRYTLTRLHARGGLGQVWLARDADLGRDVAFKELLGARANDPTVLARFLEEAKITGQLEHPNIVPVYELARPAGEGKGPFYTMRFIRGRTFAAAIKDYHRRRQARETGPLERRELLGQFVAVCNAVAYAHSRGVLHRDLKPGNVVLGEYGEVIVLDWGLAKLKGATEAPTSLLPVSVNKEMSRDATAQGQVLGTPSYMPPEQAEGRLDLVDERSDVYGLGAILYELLVGAPPFKGPDTLTILRQVVAHSPPPPRRVVPETPRALEAMCMKALEKKPADRYASAKALSQDVERWLGDEPVSAYREPFTVKAGRWVRRHRPLVTGAAALLLAAVPLSLLLAVNRDEARRQAERDKQATQQQKEIAEANEKIATEREAETRAVLDFVENRVFAAARPKGKEGGLGREVTLRKAVESTLPYLATSFRDQPLVEARLRMTLGDSFLYLGEPKLAAEHLEIARALYTKMLGNNHPDTLASMNRLAFIYDAMGRYHDGLKLKEETLTLRKSRLGHDHPDTLMSMNNLANSYERLGRKEDAHKLWEETLTLRKAKLGPDHPDTLSSMHNLAHSYQTLGRQADALKLWEETLTLREAKLGPDQPDTLWTMHNLATSYDIMGRHSDALRLREETLALRKAQLGPDHPDTLMSMNSLASSYDNMGRPAEALKLREETLALEKAKPGLGPDHPETLQAMVALAISYAAVGRHQDAIKLLEQRQTLQAKRGPDPPTELYNIACVYATIAKSSGHAAQAGVAMDYLKKAVAAGFKIAQVLKTDPDLAVLRDREDFKKLVADLEAENAKKK